MYMPTVARFTARDPLPMNGDPILLGSFPPYTYADGNPVDGIDPSGMLTIRRSTKKRGHLLGKQPCGNPARVFFDFLLDSDYTVMVRGKEITRHGAPCDGFLIQRVLVECRVNDCADKAHEESFEYFESWKVKKHAQTFVAQQNQLFTDEALYNIPDKTEGSFRQYGEVKFYCNEDVDSRAWPLTNTPVFYGTGPCRVTSGGLPSTQKEPAFWSKKAAAEGPAYRDFWVNWCCCPNSKKKEGNAGAAPE